MSLAAYQGMRVLVTGGLGFIGSNLALRLEELGASVTVVDSLVAGCGGNRANLAGSGVRVIEADLSEPAAIEEALARAQVVFNLAGEISHIHSMEYPERDLHLNTLSQLRFLDACRRVNRGVRIVYAGTRQTFGRPRYLPVDEQHPIRPIDFNGVHKYAATMYHLMMSELGELDAMVLLLTNVYGPRMSLNIAGQGFLGVFFRKALLGEPLAVYGDGEQLRDPVYVDDVAEAFLLAGVAHGCVEREYNIGGAEPLMLREIAEEIGGEARRVPFPAHLQPIDIGSYYTDSRRAERVLGWRPRTSFGEGVRRTMDFYRLWFAAYLDPQEELRRELPEHAGIRRRLEFTISR
ncbi:NAD-dependent epimerase/dehydratase family protein [Bryobacter aggregatus]|uniref:NAD-dependent epimerase/dehydratase family protein n=1 Tax=Bryobacter aggregatus TaxID=360054 RepID=UPI0006903037|nr:NAD-dependent epimerase/dehydratase family protein [Bryobacter aggregatus]